MGLNRFEYNAVLDRVVDGDTVDLRIDLGFEITHKIRVRLLGIDAPERFTDEGKAATAALNGLLEGEQLVVRTRKDRKGKYGRYLADIDVVDERGLLLHRVSTWMLLNEYAVVRNG